MSVIYLVLTCRAEHSARWRWRWRDGGAVPAAGAESRAAQGARQVAGYGGQVAGAGARAVLQALPRERRGHHAVQDVQSGSPSLNSRVQVSYMRERERERERERDSLNCNVCRHFLRAALPDRILRARFTRAGRLPVLPHETRRVALRFACSTRTRIVYLPSY